MGIAFLLIALVLSVMVFRLTREMEWHWGTVVVFALVPVVATFFFGILGLVASAFFVGGLYKACA